MARKGEVTSPEVRAKIGAANRNRKRTDEARERMRQAHLGKKHTEETKQKIAAAHRGVPEAPEVVERMRATKRGKPVSAAARAVLLNAARRPKSEETRRKMSEKRKEVLRDPEQLKRLGAAVRARWAALTPEQRSAIALPGRLACYEKVRLRQPTSIEVAVGKVLEQMGIEAQSQASFKYYIADFYIPEYNLIVECDGDYWHSRASSKANDKRRDAWFAKKGIRTIRLKECDIRADAAGCVATALKGII